MTLPVLELLPERAGYRTRPKGRVLRATYNGAQGRYRRTYDGPGEVRVQWALDAPQYDTIVGFYRDTLKNGALPFSIDLVMEDSTPETHTARIIPGTFRLRSIEGEEFTVTARLELVT